MFVEMWLDSVAEQSEPSEHGASAWEVLSAAEEEAWAAAVADLEPGDPLEMPPGWPLAVHLDMINLDTLTGEGLVAALRAHARLVSHHQAHLSRLVIAVSDRLGGLDAEDVSHATVAELRAALCLTRRAAETELDLAISLCRRLPDVFAAFERGVIDVRRVRVLIDTPATSPSGSHEKCALGSSNTLRG